MNHRLSVIVPVYNASKYLQECLESVCSQTLQDIEIICINDGSTDDSLEILKEFQKRDARIIIIDQKKQGVSAARNAGLEIAIGKYVGFVDSDDSISPEFFQNLVQEAERLEADAVYSRFDCELCDNRFKKVLIKEELRQQLLPEFFYGDNLNSVCVKLFRAEILQKNDVRFSVGVKHGEDAQFNIEFLMMANKISLIDYCGYHYREVEGSATRNIAAHDYLNVIVEVYQTDWKPIIGTVISDTKLLHLQQIRFINSIISLIYIYGNRGNGFTERQRISNLKRIVENTTVHEVFTDESTLTQLNLQGYSLAIFRNIRQQNVFLLYLLTQYSYYRNK